MFLKELIVCVAYLRQKSRVNFRATKVDAGKLKRKYLNRPWSTLAVKVLSANRCFFLQNSPILPPSWNTAEAFSATSTYDLCN
jgi:hypothetical protein